MFCMLDNVLVFESCIEEHIHNKKTLKEMVYFMTSVIELLS